MSSLFPSIFKKKDKDLESQRNNERYEEDEESLWTVFKEEYGSSACVLISITVIILIIVLLSGSFTKIEPVQTGIFYHQLMGELQNEPLQQGLQTKPLFGEAIIWPAVYTSVEFETLPCNSADGLQISLNLAFQFVPNVEHLYDLTLTYKDFSHYEKLLRAQSVTKVIQTCGMFSGEDFQNQRSNVSQAMGDSVTNSLQVKFYATVARFQLRDITRPNDYERVIKEKENARSDIRLANNERLQAVTKAKTKLEQAYQERERVIDEAKTQARITIAKAETYAEGLFGRYQSYGEVYANFKNKNNMTINGVLTYISNSIFSGGDSVISVQAPSSLTFVDEL